MELAKGSAVLIDALLDEDEKKIQDEQRELEKARKEREKEKKAKAEERQKRRDAGENSVSSETDSQESDVSSGPDPDDVGKLVFVEEARLHQVFLFLYIAYTDLQFYNKVDFCVRFNLI